MMAYNNTVKVTRHRAGASLLGPTKLGPRPGWGTALGLLILSVSLVVWLQAQPIIVGLMNGGHVNEGSATAALETLRRNAAIGTAVGSILSLRIALTAVQAILASTAILSKSVVEGSPDSSSGMSHWRSGRYASDMDSGGLTLFLMRTQHFFADLPNQTVAIISRAAVFFWVAFSLTVTTSLRAAAFPVLLVTRLVASSLGTAFEFVARNSEAVAGALTVARSRTARRIGLWLQKFSDTVRPPLLTTADGIVLAGRLVLLPVQMLLRLVGTLLAVAAIDIVVLATWLGHAAQRSYDAISTAVVRCRRSITNPLLTALTAVRKKVRDGAAVLLSAASVAGTSLIAGVRTVLLPVIATVVAARDGGRAISGGVELLGAAFRKSLKEVRTLLALVGSAAASPFVWAAAEGVKLTNATVAALATATVWTIKTATVPVMSAGSAVKSAAGSVAQVTVEAFSSGATWLSRQTEKALNAVGSWLDSAASVAGQGAGSVWHTLLQLVQIALKPFTTFAALASTAGNAATASVRAVGRETERTIEAALKELWRPVTHVWDAGKTLVADAGSALGNGVQVAAQAVADLGRLTLMPFAVLLSIGQSGVVVAKPMVVKPFAVLWLGLTTIGLLMKIGGKWLLVAASVPLRVVWFMFATARTGIGAVPDVVRMGVWLVKNRGRNVSMSEINMPRERVLSLLAVTWAIVIGGFFLVGWYNSTREPVVNVYHWTTGHLTRDGLLFDMEKEFNSARHHTSDGTRIEVKVYNAPSELIGKYLSQRILYGTMQDLHRETNGYVEKDIKDPTIVTPSSAHWLVSVNYEVGRDVVDLAGAEPIVRPVIGIVTYEEMARCLGWPQVEIGFEDIIALSDDPDGWGSRGACAKSTWGNEPLLAFTDPTTSSTGRSLHLALYSIATDKAPENVTIEDVNNPDVVAYIKRFQGLIDHYQIGTTVLNTKIVEGPTYGHFFIMPEDNLIHLIEGTEEAYEFGTLVQAKPFEDQRMVMIYPKEGSMPRNNCACIVDADWVTELQAEASNQWIDFIREDKQQRKFMAAGFRPGTDVRLDDPASKITAEFGLDPLGPTKNGKAVLNPSLTRPEVAAEIDRNWEQVKRTAIVDFVIDTSGSMLGNKLDQVKSGVGLAMDNMASNNDVGMITFASNVEVVVPIAPKLENAHGTKIAETARNLSAGGETALFDAIHQAIVSVDTAPGDESAIRAIVVLTDGQANTGSYGLHDLVEMGSSGATEQPITDYRGWQNSAATDASGRTVPKEQVIGRRLKLGTTHDVQIFFIGVGDDADLNVGRILAQATGADVRGATEDDLAQVLQEFSRYF